MNIKTQTQRNILAVVSLLLLIIVALYAGGVEGLPGAAGGKGKGQGVGKDPKTGKDVVVNDEQLAVNPQTPGTSVVGLNQLIPGLNIHNSGGNDIVYFDSTSPSSIAFGANETQADGSLVQNVINGCSIPGGAIADVGSGNYTYPTKKHEYIFTFDDKPVKKFSIGVLDWGDFLIFQALQAKNENGTHTIIMTAYNEAGAVVDETPYTFTTGPSPKFIRPSNDFPNPSYTPRYNGLLENVGFNMKIYGDACEAPLGSPGKLVLTVEGSGITRVELHFADQRSMDPHIALWLGALEIEYDNCYNFLALSQTSNKAFDFSGTAAVTFCGGGVYSNSTAESSNNSVPGFDASCDMPVFNAASGWKKGQNLSAAGYTVTQDGSIGDPLAGTTPPANPGDCDANGDMDSGSYEITGTMCFNSIDVSPGDSVTVTGVGDDAVLYVNGSADIRGQFDATNIMIYTVEDFDVNAQGFIGRLEANTTGGLWHGFVLWANGKDVRLNGGSDSSWVGTIYAPTSAVVINGGSKTVLRSHVIGDTIDFAGNNETLTYCDESVNYTTIP